METNVLIDGEWVTRTVDVEAVLQHHDQRDVNSGMMTNIGEPPNIGILSQTMIQSPIVNHIIPVKLRGLEHNDVAYIGSDFIVLKELRPDGFLWEFARKNDFGASIRNANAVGRVEDYQRDMDANCFEHELTTPGVGSFIASSNAGVKAASPSMAILPPQFLLLQLDTGESIFLMLKNNGNDDFEIVITSRYKVPSMMLYTQPGMHLCIDPTSQYMAVAGSESYLSIFALRNRDELQSQIDSGTELQHVKSDGYISFHGVVHKMEFLYPSSDMVVLLVLVALRGKTKMMVYEWIPGSDIRLIEPLNPRGHQLSVGYRLPLLLIPLKFRSAFILVCEDRMAVFQNILEGAPEYVEFYNRTDPPTRLHYSLGPPLWVGWARPTNRMRYHNDRRDDIYIAREDGLLKFLEIDCEDLVESDMDVGEFEGRCGTALACIDYKDPSRVTGDLLIAGGDSCAGGSYLVKARETPTLIQSSDNWAPAQDFIAIPSSQYSNSAISMMIDGRSSKSKIPRPDNLFVCSGMGANGAVTELRHGLEARIGLFFNCGLPISQVWTVPSEQVVTIDVSGTVFLMAMGSSLIALHLSDDETSVSPVNDDMARLDLNCHTIDVVHCLEGVIQVTEKAVIFTTHSKRYIAGPDQLFHVQDGRGSIGLGTGICHAVIDDFLIFYTTIVGNYTYLMVLNVHSARSGMGIDQDGRVLAKSSGQVTALSTCRLKEHVVAILAEWHEHDDQISLQITATDDTCGQTINLSRIIGQKINLATIESVSSIPGRDDLMIICGMRNGIFLTFYVALDTFEVLRWEFCVIGGGSISIRNDKMTRSGASFFLLCDGKIFALRFTLSDERSKRQMHINQIWLTDASNRALPQPSITAIVGRIPGNENEALGKLVVAAGSELLIASLDMCARAVPRHFTIGGTPTRLLYSEHLNAIVVAANVSGLPTVLFLDLHSGKDLSWPVDGKTREPIAHVSGLGRPNERIFRLMEWPYTKGSKTWHFIIVATSDGRLLIISAEPMRTSLHNSPPSERDERPKIQYHTRYKLKCPGPIYSLATIPGGLLLCSGSRLLCYTLETTDRKFNLVAEHELSSFARRLEYSNGTVYALTNEHSLVILNLVENADGGFAITQRTGVDVTCGALDHIVLNHPWRGNDSKIHIVSDRTKSLTGLWPIDEAVANSLEHIFEAQLSTSIIKFQLTKCRPVWDHAWLLPSDRAEPVTQGSPFESEALLGLAVDGSLHQITLLRFPALEFLGFVETLSKKTDGISEWTKGKDMFSKRPMNSPNIMLHVDGDLVRRCLNGRKLEGMLQGQSDVEAQELKAKFKGLMRQLHIGQFSDDASDESYLRQAYLDLTLYLRQVF